MAAHTNSPDSPEKTRKVMIFAGEASGDLQGAMLARELKKIYPDISFSGTGGVRMKDEGVDLILDATEPGVIGAIEGIKLIPRLLGIFKKTVDRLVATHPNVAIFIDTPACNMRLAKVARREGINSVYYFPPSAWSNSTKRAQQVAGAVDMVVNAFKATADTYDRAGVPHFYTGHPLVDFLHPWKTQDKSSLLESLGLKEGPRYIALMPGSRGMEIKYILPTLIETAEELHRKHPETHFLIPIAMPVLRERILARLKNARFPHTTFDRRSPEIMAASDLVILASGSAALEAGILEKPMIITYKLGALDYALIKALIKIKWAGLPNLILEREIIPELIQEKATVEAICQWAEYLLQDSEQRQKMVADLKELNQVLGEPGVVTRIARHIGEKFL